MPDNKDYKILSLKNETTSDYLSDNKNIDAWCEGNKGKWNIFSILRNQDNQIFTIGDEIVSVKNPFESDLGKYIIKEIKIEAQTIILFGEDRYDRMCLHNARLLKKNSTVKAIVATKESKVEKYIDNKGSVYGVYWLKQNGYYGLNDGTTTGNYSESYIKTIATPYIEPIKQEPIKKSGMKVVVKESKKSEYKFKKGDLVKNKITNNIGVIYKIFDADKTMNVFNLSEQITALNMAYDAYILFEGTIILENEK